MSTEGLHLGDGAFILKRPHGYRFYDSEPEGEATVFFISTEEAYQLWLYLETQFSTADNEDEEEDNDQRAAT